MKMLNNNILQIFLERFIEGLQDENDYRKEHGDFPPLNIPFIISSLYQSFDKDEFLYKDFIKDLNMYKDYEIYISNSSEDYSGIIDAIIEPVRIQREYHNGDVIEDINAPRYHYLLRFFYDERYYGYCECNEYMNDYREDKECCGHGCDAEFCRFVLQKVFCIIDGAWNGDEHDYWDFEDRFYATHEDIHNKKREYDNEIEIKRLEEVIQSAQERLAGLKTPKTSDDYTFEVGV